MHSNRNTNAVKFTSCWLRTRLAKETS